MAGLRCPSPHFPFPKGAVPRHLREWAGAQGAQRPRDSKFQVHESPACSPLCAMALGGGVGVGLGGGGGGEGVAHVWTDTLQRPTPRAPSTRTHYSPAVARTRPRNRACTPTRSDAHALSPTPARVLHPRAVARMCRGPAVTAPASLAPRPACLFNLLNFLFLSLQVALSST